MFRAMLLPLMVTLLLIGAGGPAAGPARGQGADSLRYEGETHLRNILTKLDAGSRTEAVVLALQRGLIALEEVQIPHAGQ